MIRTTALLLRGGLRLCSSARSTCSIVLLCSVSLLVAPASRAADSMLALFQASGHLIQVTETVIYSDGTVTRETTDWTRDAVSPHSRKVWHLSAADLAAVRAFLPQVRALPQWISEQGRLRLDPPQRSFEFTLHGTTCYSSFESYTDTSLATEDTAHFTKLWEQIEAIVAEDEETYERN